MLDFFPTRRTVRVSVVPVEMTTFWIGWFVIGQLQKQAQQQSNGNCELQTANCKLQKQILRLRRRMTTKKQTKDDNKKQTKDDNKKNKPIKTTEKTNK